MTGSWGARTVRRDCSAKEIPGYSASGLEGSLEPRAGYTCHPPAISRTPQYDAWDHDRLAADRNSSYEFAIAATRCHVMLSPERAATPDTGSPPGTRSGERAAVDANLFAVDMNPVIAREQGDRRRRTTSGPRGGPIDMARMTRCMSASSGKTWGPIIAVTTEPGFTALQRTPCCPNSTASVRVSALTPPLLVPYAAPYGTPDSADVEEVFTMLPFDSIKCGSAA